MSLLSNRGLWNTYMYAHETSKDAPYAEELEHITQRLYRVILDNSVTKKIRRLDASHQKAGYEHYKVGQRIVVLPVCGYPEKKYYYHIKPKVGRFMTFSPYCFKKGNEDARSGRCKKQKLLGRKTKPK